jgi:hypothetical protein
LACIVLFMFSMAMGVILEINRDFPFQVALSFDEAAMEVLDWLEDCDFEWDMYVDFPANAARYCFRTIADASAFKRRFLHAQEGRVVAGRH